MLYKIWIWKKTEYYNLHEGRIYCWTVLDWTLEREMPFLIYHFHLASLSLLSVKAFRWTQVSVAALLTAMLTESFTITLTLKESFTCWMETKSLLSSALSLKSFSHRYALGCEHENNKHGHMYANSLWILLVSFHAGWFRVKDRGGANRLC